MADFNIRENEIAPQQVIEMEEVEAAVVAEEENVVASKDDSIDLSSNKKEYLKEVVEQLNKKILDVFKENFNFLSYTLKSVRTSHIIVTVVSAASLVTMYILTVAGLVGTSMIYYAVIVGALGVIAAIVSLTIGMYHIQKLSGMLAINKVRYSQIINHEDEQKLQENKSGTKLQEYGKNFLEELYKAKQMKDSEAQLPVGAMDTSRYIAIACDQTVRSEKEEDLSEIENSSYLHTLADELDRKFDCCEFEIGLTFLQINMEKHNQSKKYIDHAKLLFLKILRIIKEEGIDIDDQEIYRSIQESNSSETTL